MKCLEKERDRQCKGLGFSRAALFPKEIEVKKKLLAELVRVLLEPNLGPLRVCV